MKRLICLLLALAVLTVLPAGAMAAKKPSITLGAKLGLMYVGDTAQLTPKLKNVPAGQVTCATSDPAVATVSATGLVEAAGEGRAVITIEGGGASASCGVVVLPRAVTVSAGMSVALPNGTLEQYRVKDADIATVSLNGVVTGVSAGSTAVAVKYGKQVLTVNVLVTGEADAEAPAPADPQPDALDTAGASQVVLVEYTGGSSATLSAYEKSGGAWTRLLQTSAYVGKNGIGKTKEGDKKTPTGVYNLTTPFGNKPDPGAQMAYTEVTKYHYWCGSSKSEYYNTLVDSRVTGRSYTSSDEHLIDYGSVYNYCMFIDYNAEGVAGKGSCIFLHCKGKNPYTAGCVAIDEASMKQIIRWARPGVKIVIRKA